MQFVLHGEIPLPLYKWRFFTSFLHPTLILYLIFYPPTLVMDMNPVFNRLSAIAAEIGQLENAIQERTRMLRLLGRNFVTPTTRGEARVEELKRRIQALRAEQQGLIVEAVIHANLGD